MVQQIARKDAVRYVRQYAREHDKSSLAAALRDPGVAPQELISGLLYASGFSDVSANHSSGVIAFMAGATPSSASAQLMFDPGSGQISGAAANLAEKTYDLVRALESELETALYLPRDMRRRRVQEVCGRIGVDDEFLELVVRNTAL